MIGRLAIVAGLALGLAACHDKQADTGKSAAAAEVLPGSASDAMIAYDTLRSQPPATEPTQAGSGEDQRSRDRDTAVDPLTDQSDAAAPAAASTDTPVAAPSATASRSQP